MALKSTPSPDGGLDVLRTALRDLTRPSAGTRAMMENLKGGGPGAMSASGNAVPVYTIAMGDVLGADYLDQAKPVGWRHIVKQSEELGVADLKDTDEGPRFMGLTWGPLAANFAQAASLAEELADGPGEFEARVIEAPSLNVAAIWLEGPTPHIIPYAGFGVGARLSVDEFQQQLMKRAEARLALKS